MVATDPAISTIDDQLCKTISLLYIEAFPAVN
jgi:hypothetical protein